MDRSFLEADVGSLVSQLSQDEKILLLGGSDFWRYVPRNFIWHAYLADYIEDKCYTSTEHTKVSWRHRNWEFRTLNLYSVKVTEWGQGREILQNE